MSMECGCEEDSYSCDNGPQVFSASYPRAKKQHRCCECGGSIRPGEEYERAWGVWVGEMSTYKTCMTCVRIRRDYGCSASYGWLRWVVWELLGVDYVSGAIAEV